MIKRDKINILHLPTPLEKLENISNDLDINLYCKRDDLTNLATGGNKLRKLEYFLKDAIDNGSTMLITEGGAQTNHGRLTAAVAAKYNLKCAIITSDEYPGEISANLILDGMMGCHVHFVKDMQAGRKAVIDRYKSQGEKIYYIPMGGSNPLGILGYYEAAVELDEQARNMNIPQATVYVTVGSIGTYLGLLLGLKSVNSELKLIGINVLPYEGSGSFSDNVKQAVMDYFSEVKDFFRDGDTLSDVSEIEILPDDIDIKTGFIHGAYNNAVPEVREMMYYMARKEGIIIDPCYTGKTFEGLVKMVKNGDIKPGSDVIFIHTGGYPGIYTKHHRVEIEKDLMEYMHIEQI